MSDLTAPVSSSNRISSLDIIRGVAILGILWMHMGGFGLPNAYSNPSVYGGSDGWNLRVWLIGELFYNGAMRGLFTILFGAGVILLTTRLESKGLGIQTADIYYRRNIWLLLFGLFHAYILLGPGDILFAYGLFGFVLFPFRHSAPTRLVMLGLILTLIGMFMYYSEYREMSQLAEAGTQAMEARDNGLTLTAEQEEAIHAWESANEVPTEEELQEEIEVRGQGGYVDNIKANIPMVQYMQTKEIYHYWVWDVLPLMFVGMALFKWGVLQGARSVRFYLLLFIIGYGIGIPFNYYEATTEINNNWSAMAHSQALLTKHIGRIAVTFGHIGFLMLFIKLGWLRWLQQALAATGRMALTNYMMQTVLVSFMVLGYGFGLYGKLQRYELYYILAGVWIFQLILSPIWLTYFRYGPAEWLWRSLTYRRWQPIRKLSLSEMQASSSTSN